MRDADGMTGEELGNKLLQSVRQAWYPRGM